MQNNTNIRLNTPAINGDADRAIAGNLSIVSGSSLLLSTTALNKLTVGGNLQLNGTLTLPTVFGGDLYVAGNWNRPASGVFTPNDRAVFFYGSANSTITASGGELFPNLFLTKNLLSQTLTLLDDISISKQFDVTTGTFDLAAKNATLVSNATGTASFGKVGLFGDVAYSGAGRFIVERYIPTGVLAGQHVKSWQLLAVPDNGGQTINAGWQEGNLPLAVGTSGLGTIITSNVAGAGFDLIAGVGPSMKSFVPATATWLGVPNTTATALHNKKGYFILVRGDRNVSTYNAPPTPTTLRTTGKLFVPASNPPASTTVLPGKFESIGNPYASAIDFLNIIKPPAPAVDDVFYVWDPLLPGSNLLGGYQTISSINAYKPSPGGTINYSNLLAYTKIQSGQAFLVHSTGAGGTVSFTENAKIAGSNMVYRPTSNTGITSRQYFRASLYTAAGNIADGNVLAFDQSFTNDYEANDALKILNAGENFGIDNDHKILAIEARSLVTRTDTIQYNLGNLRAQTYQFRFGPENMAGSGITAFLEDRFLRTSTLVSLLDSSFKDFSVTGDPASAAADRFRLIFIKRTRTTGSIPLIVADNKPAKSPVAEINTTVPSISVYPNPVVEGLMQVRFNNKTAGDYTLQLTTGGGQLVLQTNVYVSGKSTIRSVKLGAITAGYFLLNVISEKGEKSTVAVLVN